MWPNLQESVDLVTFTEEVFNRQLHFLCGDSTVLLVIHQELLNPFPFLYPLKTSENRCIVTNIKITCKIRLY